MNAIASEYGLRQEPANGHAESNGNGHHHGNNGNGKGIFKLERTTDPDTLAVLEARRNALADARLHTSAKAFFCEVIDRALNPSCYDTKGVVTVSDSIFAETFSVSPRTVYQWKYLLAECGYVWLTKKPKSNMWPLTTYHLTCLHKPRQDSRTDSDGTYGGRKVRWGIPDDLAAAGRAKRNAKLAALRSQPPLPLAGGVAVLPGSPDAAPEPKTEDLQAISADSRLGLRPSAETNFGGPPKPTSAVSRNQFRRTAEANFGGEPKPTSAEGRSLLRPGAEAGCRHIETQKGERDLDREGRGGKTPPPPQAEPGEGGKGGGRAPRDGMVHWDGQWWFPSKLHRQLQLLEEGISQAEGPDRKRLRDRRHSLLVALGVAAPKATPAQTRRIESQLAKVPTMPPADLDKLIAQMKEAAR